MDPTDTTPRRRDRRSRAARCGADPTPAYQVQNVAPCPSPFAVLHCESVLNDSPP